MIDPHTMLFARINKHASTRGITPYNTYLEQTKINALCLEFHNPNLKQLLDGMKALDFKGAITVAFEYEKEIFELIDEIDPIAEKTKLVGFVTLRNGKYKGYAQGGWGLLQALKEKTMLSDKKIVLIGAGHMAKGLLLELEAENIYPKEIEIYNRTTDRAEDLATEFSVIKKIGTLNDLKNASGDILINVSEIGAPWQKGETFIVEETTINNFAIIADVNFVPLKTQLITTAEKLHKTTIPGWVTFQYGTLKCLETILNITVNKKILGDALVKDFASNWS